MSVLVCSDVQGALKKDPLVLFDFFLHNHSVSCQSRNTKLCQISLHLVLAPDLAVAFQTHFRRMRQKTELKADSLISAIHFNECQDMNTVSGIRRRSPCSRQLMADLTVRLFYLLYFAKTHFLIRSLLTEQSLLLDRVWFLKTQKKDGWQFICGDE